MRAEDRVKEPPEYPVTCPKCGVLYGPGGEVGTHRPGSPNCTDRARRAHPSGFDINI